MKIAILTLPLHCNYGGILQAYALQKVLVSMGHDAYVLDAQYKIPELRIPYWKLPFKSLALFLAGFNPDNDIVSINPYKQYRYVRTVHRKQQVDALRTFVDRNIKLYATDGLSDLTESDFDAYVVGSDQVWRPMYFLSYFDRMKDAFLAFTKGWKVRRIAYAASFGVDKMELPQVEKCAESLADFDAVSVREISGVNLCGDFLSCDAVCVPDPALLLDASDYQSVIADYSKTLTDINSEGRSVAGQMNAYILDRDKTLGAEIEKLARSLDMNVQWTNNPKQNSIRLKAELKLQRPVEEWIRNISEADFVLTDSFHACVFSIIFHRPFAVLLNSGRGTSRIISLLEQFKLSGRILDVNENNLKEQFDALAPVDWDEVDAIRKEMALRGRKFLEDNLC